MEAQDIPIIANTSAEPITEKNLVRNELKNQLQNCVLWSDSIEYMIDQDVDTFYEIGPGSVLSGMIKRINSDLNVKNIGNYDQVLDYVSKDYKSSNIEKLSFFKKSNKSKQKIAKKILSYALENKNSIDESIIRYTNDKSIERIPKTDLSILRMAISEISCGLETPVGVIVNESVKLGDVFGSDTSKNFINGVLSSMVR